MTRWMPDTCGCEIEYDDNIAVVAVFKKCAKHAGSADDKQHFDTVLAHNRKKNAVRNAISDHLKGMGSAAADTVAAFYDDNDDLHVVGSGLSASDGPMVKVMVGAALGKSTLTFVS